MFEQLKTQITTMTINKALAAVALVLAVLTFWVAIPIAIPVIIISVAILI